jgi:hypothetical protein
MVDSPLTDRDRIVNIFNERGFVYRRRENTPQEGATTLALEHAGVEIVFAPDGRLWSFGTLSLLDMLATEASAPKEG